MTTCDILTDIPPGALTLSEAGRRLRLGLRAVQRLVRAGHLHPVGLYRPATQRGAAGQIVSSESVEAYRKAPLKRGRPRKLAPSLENQQS